MYMMRRPRVQECAPEPCSDGTVDVTARHWTPCSAACNGTRHLLSTCPSDGAPASGALAAYAAWYVEYEAPCNTRASCAGAGAAAAGGPAYVLATPRPVPAAADGASAELQAYFAAADQSVSTGGEIVGSGEGSLEIACGYGCTADPPPAHECRCVAPCLLSSSVTTTACLVPGR